MMNLWAMVRFQAQQMDFISGKKCKSCCTDYEMSMECKKYIYYLVLQILLAYFLVRVSTVIILRS